MAEPIPEHQREGCGCQNLVVEASTHADLDVDCGLLERNVPRDPEPIVSMDTVDVVHVGTASVPEQAIRAEVPSFETAASGRALGESPEPASPLLVHFCSLELLSTNRDKVTRLAAALFEDILLRAGLESRLPFNLIEEFLTQLCQQLKTAPPPASRLRALLQRLNDGPGGLTSSKFQQLLALFVQQLRKIGASSARQRKGQVEAQRPSLQPQVVELAKLLGALGKYVPPSTQACSGHIQYEADAHLQVLAVATLGPEHWLSAASVAGVEMGWDPWASVGMLFSQDCLTATKAAQFDGWAGALGPVMTDGVRHFGIRVWQPIDDAFFVGVCSPDVVPGLEPKRNEKAVLWSGGSASRPGTVRLFGEKLRQMATYVDGDVIGVAIDVCGGGVTFYKNGQRQFHFGSACRGPMCPYFSAKHGGPSATLLPWSGPQAAPVPSGLSASLDEDLSSARVISVDGSMLEGGGQVLRVALGCAALLRAPLHIHSIRAGRTSPGLGAQHSAGAKLVADCCNGLLSPDSLNGGLHCAGVNELRLWPSVYGIRGGTFAADTRSAGATTLLLQAALPCCLLGAPGAKTRLHLKGGTNVKWSPPVDHTRFALLPLLRRMGVGDSAVDVDVRRRGFYPFGGGEVVVTVSAVHSLQPLHVHTRGDAISVHVAVFARGIARPNLKPMADATRSLLRGSSAFKDAEVTLDIDFGDSQESSKGTTSAEHADSDFEGGLGALTRKQRRAMHLEREALSFGACGVQLVAFGSLGGVVSADSLALDDFMSAPAVAVKLLEEQWAAGGAIDEHLMDQVVLYMALAKGRSSVLCNGKTSISSQHLETAVELTTRITGVPFTLSPCLGASGAPCVRVECEGLGWLNEQRWQGHALGIRADRAIILELSYDDAWEKECLRGLAGEGIVRDERGNRCRHITLIPMREVTREAIVRYAAAAERVAGLAVPPISFHPEALRVERHFGSSVAFVLRSQYRWRHLVAEIAEIIGASPPSNDRLFHMSVWNSNNGDPFWSVGEVRTDDFSHNVE